MRKNTPHLPRYFYAIIDGAVSRWESGEQKTYLYDHEIKNIRNTLLARPGLWPKIINHLNGKIKMLLSGLERTSILYAKFNSEIYPLSDKENWPHWQHAFSFIEQHALAPNDAAILNMAKYSTIDAFVSNDGDMEFAVSRGAYPPHKFYTL